MVIEKSRRLINYLLVAAVFAFALYSNIRIAIKNYQLRAQVAEAKSQVDSMKARNERLSLILSYYQTASYQDVEARRRLGLKRPEETALSVKGLDLDAKQLNLLEDSVYQETKPAETAPVTNIGQWAKYLSGKK